MQVAGLVTTRQRPGTAKGYVFVLMEDEHGPINVIVKPDIYQRDRTAVRMEPFIAVRGRLQKDGNTLNVIAYEIQPLRVPGAPVHRRGLSRSYRDGRRPAAVRETAGGTTPDDLVDFQKSLPETLEYWTDTEEAPANPYRYLTALRQSPPGIKNFG